MHTRVLLLLSTVLSPLPATADLWITNFSTAAGDLASGVWRNNTTATDLTIPVTLTQDNAVFDEETILDDSYGWDDDLLGVNVFEPNYTGDFVSLEVIKGATASVTIAFNAQIVNPVLHFSDIDRQTTMVFSNATPTKVAGPSNLRVIDNSVTPSGDALHPILRPNVFETLGSLQFNGTFSELSFQLVNTGTIPDVDDDRTGFSVSTTTEPAAAPTGELTIWRTTTHLHLSWPSTSTFSRLEYSPSLQSMSWMPLPGSDPTATTTWSAPFATLGDIAFIRGVY